MSEGSRIPFSKVDCSGSEMEYITQVLESGWLTTASKALQLESDFRKIINCKHALAVNSCTSALHLALEALGVSRGDKVFVPSMTFTASAEVIRYLGADPVVIDVDAETCSINPKLMKSAIEAHPDVKILICVHFGGLAMPMLGEEGILKICKDSGISIVEDAAHALPCSLGGRSVGTFGDVTCFSFYANKTMTTGEGGMVTTNNDQIASRIKLMRLHGIDRDVWNRFTENAASWEYDVIAPGFKYNMPDLNAAVGIAQLERLHEMHLGRTRCASYYYEHLGDLDWIELPFCPDNISDHSWHLYPIRVKPGPGLSRNNLIKYLNDSGIDTSVHYKPIHQLSYYKNRYNLDKNDFPNAESIWKSTVSLPIYNSLTIEELDRICTTVKTWIKK